MNYEGILIGVGAFVIIGALHPIVIIAGYHFGKRVWPAFLAIGLACCAASLWLPGVVLPALAAVLGCSLLWSIRELYEQAERVNKGWFPENPRHKTAKERAGDKVSADKV
jgi:hypothetical protein